jgi:uncharacterized membrane protein
MKAWLVFLSEHVITAIDAVALLVIVYGTAEVLIGMAGVAFRRTSNEAARELWMRYARWLVAALTFQLAADIIETSITTSWEAIGRVAAVGVIRTLLDYFLDRDIDQVRARQREKARSHAPDP